MPDVAPVVAPASPSAAAPATASAPGAPNPTVPVTPAPAAAAFDPRSITLPEAKAPTPPDAYDKASFEAYQRDLAFHQRGQDFRSALSKMFEGPVSFGDGLSYAFTSKEEAQSYIDFISDLSTGRRQLTPQQFLLLHRQDEILRQAREAGAKGYETGLRSRQPAAKTEPSEQTVVPKLDGDKKTSTRNGRVPSTEELYKQQFPDEYSKITKGEARLR